MLLNSKVSRLVYNEIFPPRTDSHCNSYFCYDTKIFLRIKKTADLKLSEQLEYKCYLAKVISTLNLNWYMFAVMFSNKTRINEIKKYLW